VAAIAVQTRSLVLRLFGIERRQRRYESKLRVVAGTSDDIGDVCSPVGADVEQMFSA